MTFDKCQIKISDKTLTGYFRSKIKCSELMFGGYTVRSVNRTLPVLLCKLKSKGVFRKIAVDYSI